jgi:hypothetical protein
MRLVPFKRELHRGMSGPDVRALQRALRKADVREGRSTAKFRAPTKRQVVSFQKHHGIRKHDGVVRAGTWRHLQPFFDGYDLYLVTHMHTSPPVTDEISKMVKVAWWYYGQRPLHYLQQRPMIDFGPPPNIDTYMDCSEFATLCARAAGLPDPNGMGYDGYGNTDTMIANMKAATGPAKGRLAFYDNPGHVNIIVGQSGSTWMVIGHGSEGGPHYYPMNYRTPSHYRRYD